MSLCNPCNECLVRACCSDVCHMMRKYVTDVLEAVINDPHHEVLSNFTEQQVSIILSTANTMRHHRKIKNEDDIQI